jgi:hypothetical protein
VVRAMVNHPGVKELSRPESFDSTAGMFASVSNLGRALIVAHGRWHKVESL